jgi:PAP2 superfamily
MNGMSSAGMITIGRIMSRSGARGSGGLPRAPPLSRRRTLPTPGDDGGHSCIIMMVLDRQGGRRVGASAEGRWHGYTGGYTVVEKLPICRVGSTPTPRSTSWPSGHAASCIRLHNRGGGVWPGAGIPLSVIASLVAYSRVHTGVHYPSDAIAGALSGMALGQLVVAGSRRRRQRPRC